jgi:ceramide glucosyltransferase
MLPAFIVLVSLSLILVLTIRISQWSVLREPIPPTFTGSLPPVRILKPLKGVDAELEENLHSIFNLDYPEFDVALGAEDPQDPALEVAKKVMDQHPGVPSMVIGNSRAIGPNPKVNNLANLILSDGPELILISDSNVRVPREHLRDLVARHLANGRGLSWSLFRGTGGKGLGGALEELQLNTFVFGGACAILRLTRLPGALGKSMLLSRSDLALIGGFGMLSRYLAEDQVMAEQLVRFGRPVVASNLLVDNILGRRTITDFAARHLRWARLRRNMNLPAYLLEALINPVFLALVGLAVLRTPASLIVAGITLGIVSLLDAWAERCAGVKRNIFLYPPLELALSVAKGLLWFVPLFSRKLEWRGNVIKIGRGSLIETEKQLDKERLDFIGPGAYD